MLHLPIFLKTFKPYAPSICMFVHLGRTTLFYLISFLLVLSALTSTGMVQAQSAACTVNQFSPSFPSSVNPGQQFQVTTTLGITCYQWRTYYTGRLDLVDKTSHMILSSSYLNIGFKPTYTSTITSNATAPSTNGPLNLALNLYIFEEASMVQSSLNHPVQITVGSAPANAPVAATTAQANQPMAQSNAALPLEATTSVPTETQTALATGASGMNIWPYAIAAMIAVIVLAALVIFAEQKHKA
jgi:hypothetical protein